MRILCLPSPSRLAIVIAHFVLGILLACQLPAFAADEDGELNGGSAVSFRFQVLPILSKQGCSSGACHGSPTGKGGFQLSLRGFDPKLDELTMLRQAFGRRVDRFAPRNSLLLRKPLMETPHGGGKRIERDQVAHRLLTRWIVEGCRVDADAPACTGITASPPEAELHWPQDSADLRVTARFADGSEKDITRLAIYSSSDDRVASVNTEGKITLRENGEATVIVRFLDFVVSTPVALRKPKGGFTWKAPATGHAIDRMINQRLEKLQIEPSPICRDQTFVRRAYLDVIGLTPTRQEVEAFLDDEAEDKRARLVDALLEREEYATFWAQKRGDLLRVRNSRMGRDGALAFSRWLVDSVAANQPYDQFATAVLTAQGNTREHVEANYYRASTDVHDCAETASQVFLGVRIQCAKCHNHPFDRWSQDDYYGMAAFFAQVKREAVKGKDEFDISLDPAGKVTQPRTGEVMTPQLPADERVTAVKGQDPRAKLAEWLTGERNPFFARAAVNRIWAALLGRGIVEPVDDFNASNPPSHPDVLDWLTEEFVRCGYDQKHMIRVITRSQVYQRSSGATPSNVADEKYFSYARPRLLSAEQLLDAITHVTGVGETFAGLPPGTRATALPSPDYGVSFLKTFGQPSRNSACECERQDGPNLTRALQLINGDLIPKHLADRTGRIGRLYDNTPSRLKAAGDPPKVGLVAWFRADAEREQVADGQAMRQWSNLVEGRPNVLQEAESQRPVYSANAVNGLAAVRFDGRDDCLHNRDQSLLPAGGARTVIVVGRLHDPTGGALVTFGRDRKDGASVFTAQHVVVGGSHYVYSDGVNGAGNATALPELMDTLSRPFVTTFVSAGAGEKLQVRVNGQDITVQQAGAVGVDRGSEGFTIGSREDLPLGDQIWGGDIAEVLIFDRALDAKRLNQAERYLSIRYDLTSKPVSVAQVKGAIREPSPAEVSETVIEAYYAALSRPPTGSELQVAEEHVRESPSTRSGLEDVLWALLNSKEFLFQH